MAFIMQHLNRETHMKKLFILSSLLVFCVCFTKQAAAQYYFFDDEYYDRDMLFEAGISANVMNSLTDLGGHEGIGKRFLKDLNMGKTHGSFGVFGGAIYKNAVAFRIEGTYGKVSGNDDVLIGITDIAKERYNRNLNFRSTIYDVQGVFEFHPIFLFINWAKRDDLAPRYSPYFSGGVGYFSFNPQGTLPGTNRYINLQPLHTEGQGFPTQPDRPNYKLQQFNYNYGFGVKYEISRLFNLRLETVYRKLNTDYLDDLSTRYINPADFDLYLSPEKAALAKIMNDKQINPVATPSTGRKRGNIEENDGYFTINLKMSLIIGRSKAVY